jgi:hypothetical protein
MREPKLIPIYDASAPIACTISDAEIPGRIELIERMRAAMRSIDRTPTGLLLHFPDRPDVRADLASFATDEARCCRFWGFDIAEEPSGVTLRWDGPPSVDELLDRLQTFFSSDVPASLLDGLL